MNGNTFIGRRTFVMGILGAVVAPALGQAQMDQVKPSMAALKAKAAQLERQKSTEVMLLAARTWLRCISAQQR